MGSGNGYKVRLLLAQLGIAYKLVERDILKGETRTPEFLAKNPNGRIPTLAARGRHLPRGVRRHPLVPRRGHASSRRPTGSERARTLQWMFFEQYSHEPYIAVARFWKHFFAKLTPQQELELPNRMKGGYAALGVMEQHLAHHQFFVGNRYGIADIALYGYTHVAQEGGFLLDNYPHVTSWLSRVAAQPGYVSMDHKN